MRRILVVEDESEDALLMLHMLAQDGYDVRLVYDGKRALQHAQEFQPELVILDYKMPEIHGADVAWQLASDVALRSVPIIVCTGFADPELAAKFPSGPKAIPILQKPVQPDRLRELVRQALK